MLCAAGIARCIASSAETPAITSLSAGPCHASPRTALFSSSARASPFVIPLPDASAHVLRPYHRISRFASESGRKLRHVRERAIHPENSRRVRIGLYLKTSGLRRENSATRLRIRQEKPLFRREAIDGSARFSRERFLKGVVCDRYSDDV